MKIQACKVAFKVVSVLAVAGLSSSAFAEGGCAADAQKFCAGVKAGGGRIARCLKEHDAELSPSCKARGEEIKTKLKEGHEACKGDIEHFCQGVKRGGGRVLGCLKEHKAELSETCKTRVK